MTKSASAVALLALLGTAFVAPPAAADPPPGTPTVTLTGSVGGNITELQEVTVSDLDPLALSVRLQYPGLGDQVHPVEAGVVAPFHIETWGLGGNKRDLVVMQCADVEATAAECGAPVTISTKVMNPTPTYDFSRPGTNFSQDFDLTTHLAVTSGSPRLRLTLDSGTPTYVDPEDVTPVDTDALAEGAHSITIDVCSADQSRCITGASAPFDVVRSVTGDFSLSATAFSPNGDGQFDTIDFDYTPSSPWSSATVEVHNAADELVFDSPVSIPAGTFSYDGKDELGVVLPDGSYTATLSATRTLDSGDVASSTFPSVGFTVDNTALAPAVAASPSTFYPYVDGYRDTTKLDYTGPELYSRIDFVVRNAANTVVRTKQILVPADASWNGRNDAGSRVPDGSYTVRIRVIDTLGNVAVSQTPATVTVSSKKLVTVTKAVTVTPKASRVGGVTGACSTRRTPSAHGWAGSTGYLSNTRCHTTFKASIVWTLNKIKLASAVRYHWARLGWYGGPTRAPTHDRAIATLYRTDGTAVGWYSSLDYMAAQYIPSVKGSAVVDGGYLSWGFQADRGNRYDVKSFTITYKADILR